MIHLNAEDQIQKNMEQDEKLTGVCGQCQHPECKPMSGGTVCALCYEGYNCVVAERESRKM